MKLKAKLLLQPFLAVALLGASLESWAQYPSGIAQVALSGITRDPLVSGSTVSYYLHPPVLNNDGLVTFQDDGNGDILQATSKAFRGGVLFEPNSGTTDVTPAGRLAFVLGGSYNHGGIVFASLKAIYGVVYFNDAPASGGTFNGFDAPSCNEQGVVAFHGTSSGGANDGVYLAKPPAGSSLTYPRPASIAVKNDDSLDGGLFSSFGSGVAINESSQVAFYGSTTGTLGGGIYILAGTTLKRLPTSDSASSLFSFNNAGQVSFIGDAGIWLGDKDSGGVVVNYGDPAPGGGTFGNFNGGFFGPDHPPAMSNSGVLAFRASTDNGPGNGIYLWTPTGIKSIAVLGPAPGGSNFYSFDDPFVNENGEVTFISQIESAGDPDYRIMWGNGDRLLRIAGIGDQVLGVNGHTFAITDVQLADFFDRVRLAGRGPINDQGQVAYLATYTDVSDTRTSFKGVFIFTPPPDPPVITTVSTLSVVAGRKFSFPITATNKPTKFKAVDHTTQALPTGWTLSATGVLAATPKQAGTFTIDLTAWNAGGSGTATLTVTVVDLSGYAGKYSGLIAGTKDDVTDTGIVNVKTTGLGGFTASGSFAGTAFISIGFIKPDGTFSFRTRTGETIALRLDQVNVPGSIAGEIDDATSTHNKIASLTLGFTPLSDARNAPSVFIGTYTFLLPTDPAPPQGTTYPASSGFGTITIDGHGAVTLTASLADSEPAISAGGWITDGGDFVFDRPNKAMKSFLGGSVSCEDPQTGDSVTGSVTWQRAGQAAPCHITVQGSRYRAPQGTVSILAAPLNFQASGAGVTAPASQAITISAADEHPANAVKFDKTGALKSMSIAAKTGRISGSFSAAVPGVARPKTFSFKGIVLQKQKRAEGFFKGPTDAGSVTVQ